jgi:hypothetical protein
VTEMRRGVLPPAAYARSFLGRTERSVLDLRDPLPAVGDLAVATWRLASRAVRPGRAGGAIRPEAASAPPVSVP